MDSNRKKLIKLLQDADVAFRLTKHKEHASNTAKHGVTVMYIPGVDLSITFTPSGRVLNVTDGDEGQ